MSTFSSSNARVCRKNHKLLGGDGTHYTKEGYQLLADTVAERIVRELAVKSPHSDRKK